MTSLGVLVITIYDANKARKQVAQAAQLGPEFAGIIKQFATKGGAKKFAFRTVKAGVGSTVLGIVFQADEIFDWLVERDRAGKFGFGLGGLKTTDEVRNVFTQSLGRSIYVHPIEGSKLFLSDPRKFIENAIDRRVDFLRGVGWTGVPATILGGLQVSAQEYVRLVLPEEIAEPIVKVLDFFV